MNTMTIAAFALLTDIFRAYRGEWAMGLGASFDTELGQLWELGLIEAAPLPTCHDRFIPSEKALTIFDVVDPVHNSVHGLEPRDADRFILVPHIVIPS